MLDQIEFKPRSIVKTIVNVLVGAGTLNIVNSIIRNNIAPPETLAQKASAKSAGVVAGWMAVEKTREWTDAKVDKFFDAWTDAQDEIETNKQDDSTK